MKYPEEAYPLWPRKIMIGGKLFSYSFDIIWKPINSQVSKEKESIRNSARIGHSPLQGMAEESFFWRLLKIKSKF